ncbi:MAG TPA: serine/threonine-protein kinase [Planctomycetota bacterium]
MQPPHGSSGDSKGVKGREPRPTPLPPLVSAALEPGASLPARIARLAAHRSSAPRYTVLGQVAEGGMGRILRAWDELLAREVAMKVVPREPRKGSSDEERADHEQRLMRFLDEARITAQLDHPGIVPVYEIGLDEEGAVFFTMPLVRGQDLKKVFAQVRRGTEGWSVQRAVDVMHAVCLTVAFAHSKGVVHRDLKPENIMVGPFGEAYVMDWGLALLLGRPERATIVGTPAYMAPEQIQAKSGEVGPRADVYSLGAILYELLARRVPHEFSLEAGPQAPDKLERVLTRPPRPLAELREDVPPELAAICAKAMAREPAQRYASALEMADDLEAWLAGHTVSALEVGHWTRLRKWRSRNRAFALALEALVALVLVGAGAFVLQQHVLLSEVRAKGAEVRASAYASGLFAAELGLRAHETAEARRRLEACDPALRGWEWRHLAFRADSSVLVLPHTGSVRAVAIPPDGETIAAGSEDGSVRLWSAADGRELATLTGHAGPVTAVTFAPDGRHLASASEDDTVRLWDAGTASLVHVITTHVDDVRALAFSADGAVLASGDAQGGVALTRVADALPLASQAQAAGSLSALAFLPQSGELACADLLGFLRILDPRTLELRREARVVRGALAALAVAPAGERLAVASERTAALLDPATLLVERTFEELPRPITSVAFDASGQRLATTSYDGVVRLLEAGSGRTLAQLDGHQDSVRCSAFFPDGRRLATGAEDGSVRIWDPAQVPVAPVLELDDWITALAFAPDGRRILAGGRDGRLRLVDLARGAVVGTLAVDGFVDDVAWSASGTLAYGCGRPETGLASAELAPLGSLAGVEGYPRQLVFDRTGARLFTRDSRGRIGVLEPQARRALASLVCDEDDHGTLALAPDERLLAAGTPAGEIRLWDTRTLAPLPSWPTLGSSVSALAFAPDGRHLAVGLESGDIAWLETAGGTLVRRLDGHKRLVSCLAFSPDGTRLVSGSYDLTLRLWDTGSGAALLTLHGHTAAVMAVAFAPGGELLASAAKDATLRLWRTARSLE